MSNTKICYIHVAKCGGTSVVDAILNQYRLTDRLLRKNQFVNVNASASAKGSEILNQDFWCYREKILTYFLSVESNKFIYGHFPFSDLAAKRYQKEWNFISVLRDPIDRWFSHYFFNRHKKDQHFKTKLSLEEYVDTEDGQSLGMLYHRIFNGTFDNIFEDSKDTYQKAIGNIEKLSCIGVVEHMNVFYRDFYKKFGVKLRIPHKNKNPLSKKDRLNQISGSVLKNVKKICEPDIRIYKYVLKKINEGNK